VQDEGDDEHKGRTRQPDFPSTIAEHGIGPQGVGIVFCQLAITAYQ
jgi:hypothetical protein